MGPALPVHSPQFSQHAMQPAMIGQVELLDPLQRIIKRDLAGIDLDLVSDDARHGAEAARNAQGARIGLHRQRPGNEPRIKLQRLAIEIDEGTRQMREHHGRAMRYRALHEAIDKKIGSAPQNLPGELAAREEHLRKPLARMRRVQKHRHAPPRNGVEQREDVTGLDSVRIHAGRRIPLGDDRILAHPSPRHDAGNVMNRPAPRFGSTLACTPHVYHVPLTILSDNETGQTR
jgi:hypothetical protein